MEEEAPVILQQPSQPLQPAMWRVPTEFIEQILDPFWVIERFRHNLKGEILGSDGKTWTGFGTSSMNDNGIRSTISILDSYINRNTLLSNLEDTEIYDMMKDLHKELNSHYYQNWKDYDMDVTGVSLIVTRLVDMCFLALKQAQDKVLLDALTKAYSVSEVKDEGRKKSTGIGISLNPFKK